MNLNVTLFEKQILDLLKFDYMSRLNPDIKIKILY